MITEANKRATAKYKKENIVQKKIELNKKTDADILSWIEGKSFSSYIKQLIRNDITKHEAQQWASFSTKKAENLQTSDLINSIAFFANIILAHWQV